MQPRLSKSDEGLHLRIEPDMTADTPRYLVTITDDDAEAKTVAFVYEAGKPIHEAIFKKQEGLISRDFRVPFDRYVGALVKYLGALLDNSSNPVVSTAVRMTLGPPEWWQPTSGRKKGRRVTDEFLRKVADAYRAAGDNIAGINQQVDPEFYGAVDSTKFRWVKAARDRGILTDREGQ